MSNNKTGSVKARSVSNMVQSKTKVQFTPTSSSAIRMEKASQASHVRNGNNIMRFESSR